MKIEFYNWNKEGFKFFDLISFRFDWELWREGRKSKELAFAIFNFELCLTWH